MDNKNNIHIFQNADKLAHGAAKLIVELAKKAIDTKGRFVIAISGGNTPEALYTLLSKSPWCNQVPWDNTFVFWGDERCVPLNDPQNNAHMAKTLLLDKVDIPQVNVFPIPVNLPPAKAATEYEKEINTFFKNDAPKFDLILLGLGENGHTASLFPGTEVLREQTRMVAEVFVSQQKMYRVTMTARLINMAHNVMFMVEGEKKATILKTIISGFYDPRKFPAQLIKPIDGKLYWYIDKKAAILLNDE